MFKLQATCAFQFKCKHTELTHAIFPELRLMAYRPIGALGNVPYLPEHQKIPTKTAHFEPKIKTKFWGGA